MTKKKLLSGSGMGGGTSTPTVTPDNLLSDDVVEFTLGICEGPIAGLISGGKSFYLGDTPLVSASGQNNFNPFELHVYHGDAVATEVRNALGGITSNFQVGVTLAEDVPVVRTTPSNLRNQIDKLEIRIHFNTIVKTTEDGDQLDDTAEFDIQYREAGDPTWLDFGTSSPLKITGKTTSGYTRDFVKGVPRVNTDWEIRVIKRSPDNDPNRTLNFTWESYQAVTAENRSYDDLAVVRGLGRASDQFQSIPNFWGVYAAQLVRVPTNYDPITRYYDGAWDGTFKLAHTDNPAWIFYEVCMNERWGAKNHWPWLMLDRYSVYEAAQWCDGLVPRGDAVGYQPRWTYNEKIDKPRSILEMLTYLCSIFGAVPVTDLNGTVHLKIDKPALPIQIFGPESIENGVFNYQFSDVSTRVNDTTVTFQNPDLNWENDVRRLTYDAGIDAHGRIPKDIITIGCNDPYEAQRRGWRQVLQANTETTTVNFRTTRAGIGLEIFDVIGIVDPHMNWGVSGRVKSQAGSVITLRDPLFLPVSTDLQLDVQTPSGIHTVTVQASQPAATELTITAGTWPADAPDRAQFAISAEAEVGLVKPFRILRIEEDAEEPEIIAITALEQNVNKYNDIDNLTSSGTVEYGFFGGLLPAQPVIDEISSGGEHTIINPDGTVRNRIFMRWTQPPSDFVEQFVIYYRRADRDIWQEQTVRGRSAYIDNVQSGVRYLIKMVAINAIGRRSLETPIEYHAPAGKSGLPTTPSGWTAVQGFDTVTFKGNIALDPDFRAFRVYGVTAEGEEVALHDAATNRIIYRPEPGEAFVAYRISTIDTSGNESPRTADIVATPLVSPTDPVIPPTPANLGLTSFLTEDFQATMTATWDTVANCKYEVKLREAAVDPVVYPTADPRYTWNLARGTEFFISVRAVNLLGQPSPWSAEVSHTTAQDTTPPAIPANVDTSPGFGVIWVTWDPVADADLSHYEIYESVTATPVPNAGTTPSFTTSGYSFGRSGLDEEVTRYYWVRAVDTSGNASDWSAMVSATTAAPVTSESLQGMIDESSFATGLEPLKVVDTLPDPNGYTGPKVVLLSTDDKLYRYDGGAWVANVPTTDLTGEIVSGQIADAAITAAKMASGLSPVQRVATLPNPIGYSGPEVVLLTSDGKLYRYDNSVPEWTAAVPATDLTGEIVSGQIADAAIGSQHFANGLSPVETVATLPTTGNYVGRIVFLTSDEKLYRYTATGWTQKIPTVDLVGEIETDQIAVDAITTEKIEAGAITEVKVNTGAITGPKIADFAINAQKIASGAITGPKIDVDAITATHIAPDAVTAPAIADSAIDASKLADEAVTNSKLGIDAVTAAKIADLAVSGDKIAASAVTAAKIAAGTITANKLAVIHSQNLLLNSDFSQGLQHTMAVPVGAVGAATSMSFRAAGGTYAGKHYPTLQIFQSGTAQSDYFDVRFHHENPDGTSAGGFPVKPGEYYQFSIQMGAYNASPTLLFYWYDSTGTYLGFSSSGELGSLPTGSSTNPEEWTRYSLKGLAPANATYAVPAVRHNGVFDTGVTNAQMWMHKPMACLVTADSTEITPWAPSGTTVIDGGRIITETITAEQIAANTITAAEILAGTITANEIAANTITAVEIAAGAITADEIAANAVTAAKIAANTITAAEIAAGAITANEIAAGTITAAEIAAGSISSTEIATGTITADRLAIGIGGGNLLQNSDWRQGWRHVYTYETGGMAATTTSSIRAKGSTYTGVDFPTLQIVQTDATADGYHEVRLGNTTSDASAVDFIPVDDSKTYQWSAQIAMLRASGTLLLHYYDESGTYIASHSSSSITASGSSTDPDAWPRYTLTKQPPPGAVYAVPVLRKSATSSGANSYLFAHKPMFCEVPVGTVEPVPYSPGGTTVIDGGNIFAQSITAAQIAANTITAAEILAGTITANEIASNTITAAEILAGTITAAEIAAETITANELSAGSITTEKIATNAVTANEIAANTITANEIASNTITAAKIAANTITAAEIAANAITASELAADAVTAGKIQAGAISADHIATNGITAEKLLLKGRNHVANHSFITGDFTGWLPNHNVPNSSIIARDDVAVPSGAPTPYVARMSADGTDQFTSVYAGEGNTGNPESAIPIKPGRSYRISVDAAATSGTTHSAVIVRCYWRKHDGTNTTFTDPLYSATFSGLGTTWDTYTATVVAPSDAYAMHVMMLLQYLDGDFFWTNLTVEEMGAASLIVDGTITADHIAANTITAAEIDAGAVTASELAANAVTADKILAGEISTSHIATGTITADRLAITYGSNLIENAEFRTGVHGWSEYGSGGIAAETAMSVRAPGSTYAGASYPTLQMYQPGSAATDGYTDLIYLGKDPDGTSRKGMPVLAGQTYEASVQICTINSTAGLKIFWFDEAGVYLANHGIAAQEYLGSSTNPELWTREVLRAAAPAGAAYARFYVRKDAPLNSANSSYVILHKPMFAVSSPNATEAMPWTPGSATVIDGGQIIAESITAAEILAGTITANEIATGTITANELDAGAVTADKILAGAVTADKVAANAIGAKHMIVADLANLIPNGLFEDTDVDAYWYSAGGSASATRSILAGPGDTTGVNIFELSKGGDLTAGVNAIFDLAHAIPVTPGEQLYGQWEFWTPDVAASAGAYYRIRFYDENKVYVSNIDISTNRPFSSTRTTESKIMTVPAGASYAIPQLYNYSTQTTTNRLWVDRLVLRRANAGELIVDGAITAAKLSTSELITTSAQIGDAVITDAKITGTISADKVQIDGITLDTDGSGNLIIKTAGVDATQIVDGAANARSIVETTSSLTVLLNTETTLFEETFTNYGAPIEIAWRADVDEVDLVTVKYYRDDVLYGITPVDDWNNIYIHNGWISAKFTDFPQSAGTYTYKITVEYSSAKTVGDRLIAIVTPRR